MLDPLPQVEGSVACCKATVTVQERVAGLYISGNTVIAWDQLSNFVGST